MRTLATLFGGTAPATIAGSATTALNPYAGMYELLDALYQSDVYQDLTTAEKERANLPASILPIRNPTFRAVEFYAAHLFPGNLPDALPIVTENERIVEPIQQVWQWSNWGSEKQATARQYALYGDWFCKVVTRDDGQRVYLQQIHPSHVIDFDTNERGDLTYIRVDIPFTRRLADGTKETRFEVEIWDKASGRYRRWEIERANTPTEELGQPERDDDMAVFGIDFVPFCHAQFRNIGEPRGSGCVTPVIRKLWQADILATSLHERLFRYNQADWVLHAPGRPEAGKWVMPPELETNEAGEYQMGNERVHKLPAGWELGDLIAKLDYPAALAILQDHMREIENDLPELAYYNLRELNAVSGRAVRMLLSDAIARALEARGNAETALVKLNQMALTIGGEANIPAFRNIGTYENGDFDHDFEPRDIIALNDLEELEAQFNKELAYEKMLARGYSQRELLRRDGLTDKQIDEMLAESQANTESLGRAILAEFNAGAGVP